MSNTVQHQSRKPSRGSTPRNPTQDHRQRIIQAQQRVQRQLRDGPALAELAIEDLETRLEAAVTYFIKKGRRVYPFDEGALQEAIDIGIVTASMAWETTLYAKETDSEPPARPA